MKVYVIILAGGKGERMKASVNKVLMPLCGKTVIIRSLCAFLPFADHICIVSRPEEQSFILSEIRNNGISAPVLFAAGGTTRQQSVLNGLRAFSPDPDDIILIHDGARCLITSDLIERVIQSVKTCGTGVPGLPVSSTYKICDHNSYVSSTPDRSSLYEIQTPQGFSADRIIPYSLKAEQEGIDCTDDAGVLEYFHVPVRVVRGETTNIKLTLPEDLNRARNILEGGTAAVRIGMGYDVHRLVPDRKLILCGVEIPFELGLLGHSDADVALHALMDAMLGACALGDIGKHFPDSDEKYKGISSLSLLKETAAVLSFHGFRLHNADITIVAQKPKILPYISQMCTTVASALNMPADRISIKATTTESLGFEGRMEGISSYAVCTVEDNK